MHSKMHFDRGAPEEPDHRHRLLRPRRQRPRRRAAEQRDNLAPPHSITSSARASSMGGISRPSALAALRLITSSYFVGNWTGRSPGFSPFRTRSTYDAARRNRSILLAPYDIRPPSAVKKRRWYTIGKRCRIAERKIRARLT